MSNILKNLKKYEESWKVVATEVFDAEDLTLIKFAEIVKSTYGTSVKFWLEEGGYFFIPMDSKDTHYQIGDRVDLTRAIVKTLHKDGEENIQRVIFKDEKVSSEL